MDLKVKYVLYTHFAPPKEVNPVELFTRYLSPLKKLLTMEQYSGVLVLFYDPGWYHLLNTVGQDFNPVEFSQQLQKALKVAAQIQELLKNQSLQERIRLVTAADLARVVNNLRGDRAGKEAVRLRRFLVADVQYSRYDTAKVVEAIIRIRLLGSGIPVFRIDWDALFNEITLSAGAEKAKNAIMLACQHHSACHADPEVSTFVFSGAYTVQDLGKNFTEWTAKSWLNGFATRLIPALEPTAEILNLEDSKDEEKIIMALEKALDLEIVLKYYGLQPSGNTPTLKTKKETLSLKESKDGYAEVLTPEAGLTSIGSNPLKSVISGALLCLSDGAILDLPPFSNFRLNVMWIDDHLKYALHRELEHLNQSTKKDLHLSARVPNCDVYKDRLAVQKVWSYVLGGYLPTLLWGAIMDGWIQPHPCLNTARIPENAQRPKRGILSEALHLAVSRGYIDAMEINSLKKKLLSSAVERIKRVHALWSDLKNNSKNSFAAIWANGQTRQLLESFNKDENAEKLLTTNPYNWLGWGLLKPQRKRIATKNPERALDNLYPGIREGLEILIEDAVNYIEWTLEWPRFVQSVRAVTPGTLPMDMRWSP